MAARVGLVGLELRGDARVKLLFRELPKRVAKKGLRAAVTVASLPIVRAAKAGANRASGLLRKAIGKKVKQGNGSAYAVIGARKDVKGTYKGKNRVPSRYIHLVDKGTTHSAGSHFLERAYKSNRAAAEAAAAKKLKIVVEGEAAKLGR